jgi:hypothetical protein
MCTRRKECRNMLCAAIVCFVATFLSSTAMSVVKRDSDVKPLSQRSLRLRIQCFKNDFLPFEAIPLVCWVENTGSQSEFYRPHEIPALDGKFIVQGLDGSNVPECGLHITDYMEPSFALGGGEIGHDWNELEPGESSERIQINVTDSRGVGRGFFCFYLAAGTYRLNGSRIPSDTVLIRIQEPVRSEDSLAQLLLHQALNAGSGPNGISATDSLGPWKQDAQTKFALCSELVSRHPGSAYVPRALYEMLLAKPYVRQVDGLGELANRWALRLLMDFPEAGYADIALATINLNALSGTEQNSLAYALSRIGALYPNTRNISERCESLRAILK